MSVRTSWDRVRLQNRRVRLQNRRVVGVSDTVVSPETETDSCVFVMLQRTNGESSCSVSHPSPQHLSVSAHVNTHHDEASHEEERVLQRTAQNSDFTSLVSFGRKSAGASLFPLLLRFLPFSSSSLSTVQGNKAAGGEQPLQQRHLQGGDSTTAPLHIQLQMHPVPAVLREKGSLHHHPVETGDGRSTEA